MPKGGARANSGPPPDPNALRRSRKSDPAWTKISAAGRCKPAPEWPSPEPSSRELEVWRRWWTLPQALIWDESFSLDYVALVARMFVEAEQPKARTEDRKSVNSMMATLFLTPDSLLRARILITGDAEDDNAAPAPSRDAGVTDIRSRLNRGGA
ncbi:phage terminase small subunit [Nocardioides montaniterrae]